MDQQLNSEIVRKPYESPRLEAYGDAAEIAKTLDINKVDQVDIAAQGSGTA